MGVTAKVTEEVTRITVTVKEFGESIKLSDVEFETLEDGTKVLNLTWLREALGLVIPSTAILTFNITGLPDNVPVFLNGQPLTGRTKEYAVGTILPQLTLTATDYIITPVVGAGVVMDGNKSLNFAAQSTAPNRVFVVGNGSGDLLVDASDNTMPWFPLAPGDQFKINGGNYGDIEFRNLNVSSGIVSITNNNTVITCSHLTTAGNTAFKNVLFDFLNKVSGAKYGFVIDNSGNENKLIIDAYSVGGWDNLTFRGIDSRNFNDRGWYLVSADNTDYDNGAGKKTISNLTIEDCRWYTAPGSANRGGGVALNGNLRSDSGKDNGYVENFIFRRNIFENGNYNLFAGNLENFLIQDITLKGIYPDSTIHSRIIDVRGFGIMENVTDFECYGNACRIVPFNRGNVVKTSIIRNLASYRKRKYSTAEINVGEAAFAVETGFAVLSKVEVYGITTINGGTLEYPVGGSITPYTSTCLDVFDSDLGGNNITARNLVAINCLFTEGVPRTINGPTPLDQQSNNVAAVNNSATKVNVNTFIPASDSTLKGAGIANANFTKDLYGTVRLSPPTIGAVEAA